jgi:hypothetical protein
LLSQIVTKIGPMGNKLLSGFNINSAQNKKDKDSNYENALHKDQSSDDFFDHKGKLIKINT